jgi:serine phosphatase RsbU (regulator of sigma subunit)
MAYETYSAPKLPWYKARVGTWANLSNLSEWKLLSLYLAIFFLFSIFGFYDDLTAAHGHGLVWVTLVIAVLSGAYAVLYPFCLIHTSRGILIGVAVLNFFVGSSEATWVNNFSHSHPRATPATGITFDAVGILLCVIASYIFFISFIRNQAAESIRIQNELELAHGIQRTLVPPLDVTIAGYELNGISIPSDKVGGDLVDIVPVSDGVVAYVADVAGHGLQAGILMGMVKTAARTILLEEFDDPATLLAAFCERLNLVLPGVKEPHMYCTLAVLHLSQHGRVHYALAGHPAILKYSAVDKSVSQLRCAQFPVGLLPVKAFVTQETTLQAGDILVVSTDGILEACNKDDEEFGADRLGAIAPRYSDEPTLGVLSKEMTTLVQKFGKQQDDQTLLLIRRRVLPWIQPKSV